ncbi:MAG TPA: aminoacyl-tRNA hydrolase [Rhodospirillaceae bacterium]|nr:MAG: aminoacyl-tRNA hydrolase [Alphaproteobacteria bacterium GWF2_58_20]HAU29589.1 aminoacyl-tRNA hydrolase [Rhodospirillaceae bacterium]
MRLVVGLGNPGSQYAHHRHNAGFMAVDGIVRRHGFAGPKEKFSGLLYTGEIAGERVAVLKPQTFMNLSGRSVQAALAFYKLKPENLMVFHDDLDLAFGKVRVKRGGGAGGHNGLRSIDGVLGADYVRVRMGIGHPGGSRLVHDFVLSSFSPEERVHMEKLVSVLADEMGLLMAGEAEKYMTRLALLAPPPSVEG